MERKCSRLTSGPEDQRSAWEESRRAPSESGLRPTATQQAYSSGPAVSPLLGQAQLRTSQLVTKLGIFDTLWFPPTSLAGLALVAGTKALHPVCVLWSGVSFRLTDWLSFGRTEQRIDAIHSTANLSKCQHPMSDNVCQS